MPPSLPRFAFVAALLCGACSSFVRGAAASPPNILLLLSDDHSYPFVGAYGDANVRTPTLDRLAREGLRLHRFFTAAPQCVPSRAALMTGRSPVAARITRFSSPLPRDEIIFPEVLRREAHYFTGVCGRTHHLDGAIGNAPELRSVLQAHGLLTMADRMDFVDASNGERALERAREFFDRKPAGQPFFLWVNFNDPHHPWDAKEFEPDPATLKIPPHWPDTPALRRQLAAYCGEVNRVDTQVKQILDLLQQRGFAENTLVIFAGDNGLAFPHGKGSLYDPGLNVPCLVRWPGVVRPDTESRALVSGEDLAPTLLAAAGVAAPARMTGVSFLPLLRGEAQAPRQQLFAERGPHGNVAVSVTNRSGGYDLARCVRTDRYKFIYNGTPWISYGPVDSAGDPAWRGMLAASEDGTLPPELQRAYFTTPRPVYELYDLEQDPSELHNLSGTPAVAAIERELRAALTEKMIVDFDYLPLPAPLGAAAPGGGENSAPAAGRRGKKARE